MTYFQIGIVEFSHRVLETFGKADYTTPYNLGEDIPIIVTFKREYHPKKIRLEQILWITNTIEGIKPGDPVAYNLGTEEIYKIEVGSRGVGVF